MLIAERDGIAERLKQYSAVLAPVRRVPPELVCEIFSWTLPRERQIRLGIVTQPPWYLGHISRSWRNIAVDLPTLWSSVDIYHSEHLPHSMASPLEMIQTQLIRSVNAPLHVNFRWCIDEPVDAPLFFDAILPHSNRWKSLHFICSQGCYNPLSHLLQPARGRLDRLEKLELRVSDGPSAFLPLHNDIFSVAPRLRHVILNDIDYPNFSLPLIIPWEQIMHYRGAVSVQELADVLRSAPNLIGGAFWVGHPDVEVPSIAPITLPHLRQLYIEQGGFLNNLTTPNLEHLTGDAAGPIFSLVQRSRCALSTLVLTQHIRPDLLLPLLKHIPSLERLLVHNSNSMHPNLSDNDLILKAMTVSGSADDLCPNLTYLAYFSPFASRAFSSSVFLSMIRSRLRPERGCQLSALRFVCPRASVGSILLIRTLRSEGLDAIIVHAIHAFMDKALYSFILE
ncbi:hypothetical protein C8R47DRAFT_970627 [Mycena vitilis]|nr:hypothetical protein C8R47DRAFT_970627 [Mycena vitilis]